jgi:methenyltetrahydromethanopterin cyclohydrolase
MYLNQRAAELCRQLADDAEELRAATTVYPKGAQVIDCGIAARGGLEAGRRMAEVCMSGLARVDIVASTLAGSGPAVSVRTDQPVAACMASQYAGWRISVGKFFAMASGPMRALARKEPIFQKIGYEEHEPMAIGVLETSRLPSTDVCRHIAEQCGIETTELTLVAARTASQAGTVQIVARSVETAMHKLFDLGFDLDRVESGFGVAPLPPVAGDDLTAIGRTNDAILYGGDVTLWVRGDDESLEEIGPRLPSIASADYGRPFAEIFQRYGGDFYKIDPGLFAPAVVTLVNLDTGRAHRFGRLAPEWLYK